MDMYSILMAMGMLTSPTSKHPQKPTKHFRPVPQLSPVTFAGQLWALNGFHKYKTISGRMFRLQTS
jgi:hypothetical protein